MPDLSIIIVSHQSKNDLGVLLPSVLGSEGVEFGYDNVVSPFMGSSTADKSANYVAEIIIVDNGSTDGAAEFVEFFKKTTITRGRVLSLSIVYSQNNGFAAGNNLGIKQARGKYILLLNPDTKLEPDTLKTMLDFMEGRPDAGIAGCKLIKADGKLDLACRRRFPNPWNSFARLFLRDNRNYNYGDADENLSMEVDSVVGAFLLIRKSVIDKIGMLDENFFMYGEDLDWCWRCKQAGYKIWYYPKTFIWHYKGRSSRKVASKALKWFHNAMWIFYKKHYSLGYPLAFGWLIWCGIYARLGALLFINLFRKNAAVSK